MGGHDALVEVLMTMQWILRLQVCASQSSQSGLSRSDELDAFTNPSSHIRELDIIDWLHERRTVNSQDQIKIIILVNKGRNHVTSDIAHIFRLRFRPVTSWHSGHGGTGAF